MKLVDTNIIMYAVGKPHSYKGPCKDILQKIVHGIISANINVEVMQELLYVYDSRGERKKGLNVIKENLVLFPHPFAIGKDEIIKARDLMVKYNTLTTRDAIHSAVIINSKLEGIISTDKDFDTVKEITRFDPKEI